MIVPWRIVIQRVLRWALTVSSTTFSAQQWIGSPRLCFFRMSMTARAHSSSSAGHQRLAKVQTSWKLGASPYTGVRIPIKRALSCSARYKE